ncbi:MAG: Fe-S cluster assembly protein SufD [Deltaproteobacteria bacterium]|nr:Fe-S cluster assembly protein SufD [Deltaproteobacteria bacterium]
MTKTVEKYLGEFEQLQKEIGGNEPAWLAETRKQAMARFASCGFPTTRQEEWRYTSTDPIANHPFTRRTGSKINGSAATLKTLTLGTPEEIRLVFINGDYSKELSSLGSLPKGDLPEGVVVTNLASLLAKAPDLIQPYLAQQSDQNESPPFVALNTGFIKDGAFVLVPKGQIVVTPIHLIFLTTPGVEPLLSQPRNIIIAEPGGQVTLVETYIGRGKYLTNTVTQIFAADNAIVDHIKLQLEDEQAFHIGNIQAHQERSSHLASHSFSFGGLLTRNDIATTLEAEGADGTLNGLYLVRGEQHVDHHTTVDHRRPHATSRELYKGILDGHAKGVFNGKIIVRPDAQKTEARQTNKNLLLSEDAVIHTKPQLEILANDVKCNHGATIGQLDDNAIFYLRSRGLGASEAKSFLTNAFAREIVDSIKMMPFRHKLEQIIHERLTTLPMGTSA